MRALAVVSLLIALAASTSAGAAGSKTIVFGTRGSIQRIAANGTRVAMTTTGIPKQCDRVVVWNGANRSFRAFKTGVGCAGGETSGGQGLREVALAGTRVAWLEASAGNLEDLQIRTAAVTGPKISDVAFAENHHGAEEGIDGGYLGNLFGDGVRIVFNAWSVCTILPAGAQNDLADRCEGPQPPVTNETHIETEQQIWKLVRGHKSLVAKGPLAYPIVAVSSEKLATRQTDSITIVSDGGALLRKVAVPAGPLAGVRLTGKQLVTIRKGALEVYDTDAGTLAKRIALPPGKPMLRDVVAFDAVYVLGRTVHVVNLASGKSFTITPPGSGAVDAQIEASGLFYSYNLPTHTAKGQVAFVPLAQVHAKF